MAFREVAGNWYPCSASITTLEYVRLEIASLIVIEGHVERVGVVLRCANIGNVNAAWYSREPPYPAPFLSAVFGYLHQPVVRTDIEQPLFER